MQPIAGQTRSALISKIAAGVGDILQQTQPSASIVSILQQLQHLSTAVTGANVTKAAFAAAFSNVHSASVVSSSHAACSSTSGSSRSAVGNPKGNSLAQQSASLLSTSAAAAAAAARHGQQQRRGLADLALSLQGKQQLQPTRLQSGYGHAVPTEFERQVLATASVHKLAGLLEQHPTLQPKEATVALNKLTKLHKSGRTLLKQQVRVLQQQWQSLRPLDGEQQQQMEQLQQQHKQQQEEVTAVLAKIVERLYADQSALAVDHLVQVLGCFGSLAVVQQVPHGSALLLLVLQRLMDGAQALQPKHLAYLATAVAQLQDAERGSEAALDEMNDTPASTPNTSSSSRVQIDQQQQEQQQAVSELSRALVLELCTAVQQCGSLMDATALANFAAAMGRLGHYDWQTMRHLSTIAKRHTPSFNCGHAAKFLTGLTKLRHHDAELVAGLAEAAERDMTNASGVHVAQIAWALAHQRFEQASVFEAASYQVPQKAHEMQPRHVANLAWAFAVRRAYSPALYDVLAERMVQLIHQDRGADSSSSGSSIDSLFLSPNDLVLPHHLSLVAWSFAKQGHKHEAVMQAIADRAAQLAGQMLPQNVSNAAWAYGCLGVAHPALFDALSAAAKASKLEGYNNQNITDLAWGFAQVGHNDPELFELVAAATANSLSELSPHSLSDLVAAFARARDPLAHKVLEAAVPAVVQALPRFSVQMLADMLCSYAELGITNDSLLTTAAQVLPLRLVQLELDTDAQAKIIWTMKQLEWRDQNLERVLGGLIPNLAELL